VLISVPVSKIDQRISLSRYRRLVEQWLQESGIAYTIFRGSAFMEDWLALMGRVIPLRGTEATTLRRPYWFSRMFMKMVGGMIDKHGLALVAGNGKSWHAFVATDNVAESMVRAGGHPHAQNRIFELGGPEIMTFDEAAAIFGKVLGRRVQIFSRSWSVR
jgi:uncharacterized protein YbjT (DUF2867 family)